MRVLLIRTEQYQQNKPITIFGDGKQSRDFIHVSDVARANELALQSSYSGILNVQQVFQKQLINLVNYIEMTGKKKADLHFAPRRSGDITESYAAIEKGCKMSSI